MPRKRIRPDHVLGTPLSGVAAGILAFADAVRAARLRGELMFASGLERPGTMAAVLGLDDDRVQDVCRRVTAEKGHICVPANFNTPGQVVLSGDLQGIEAGMDFAREAGAKRVVPLNVSGAFHSPLTAPAKDGLGQHLGDVPFADPAFPVTSNVTAEAIDNGDRARDLLVKQLTSPVRWSASIVTMVASGTERFMELGPGSVLFGLNRRNARGLPCASIGTPEDVRERGHGDGS